MVMILEENLAKIPSSKKRKANKKRRLEPMPSVVQRLFDTCREGFADCGPGIVPSNENIQRLRSILVLPLHNHPGMIVFSKLLFGSMHIKSYDWTEAAESSNAITKPLRIQGRNLRLAKVHTNAVFKAPCATSILYPTCGGNMHCFSAKTSCAVLDVLGPPYDDSENRPCTYYNDFPCPILSGDSSGSSVSGHSEGEKYSWLEERENKPEELVVVGSIYRGPKIIEY